MALAGGHVEYNERVGVGQGGDVKNDQEQDREKPTAEYADVDSLPMRGSFVSAIILYLDKFCLVYAILG